jgi:hypothetical protein
MGYLMITVYRAHGFRYVMFTNDHSPPHVHVFGQGGEAKIVLEGDEPALVWAIGMTRADLRRILQETRRERTRLMESWRRIHG